MLVVVDGSVQASVALERAVEIAQAMPGAEMLLLTVLTPVLSWQVHRRVSNTRREVAERVAARALARVRTAGVTVRAMVEAGETADVVARIAHKEQVDHIFLAEQGGTTVARAILTAIGLSANSDASRVISLSDVPVTVVAHDRTRETPSSRA